MTSGEKKYKKCGSQKHAKKEWRKEEKWKSPFYPK